MGFFIYKWHDPKGVPFGKMWQGTVNMEQQMRAKCSRLAFERLLWMELIGFDNKSGDFGVKKFLDNAGFIPDAISFHIFNPDFVHIHDGMGKDRKLPYDCCSYAGYPYNEERKRQSWTKYQLRELVKTLHEHGVAVYFSVFDLFVTKEWIGKHPEILCVRKTGERIQWSVCPLKRLNDGTYYEDFFIEKLIRVVEDYGFDGYHGAGGYTS